VESLFLAYRLTGDKRYREQGWKIFQSIEKHAKVADGGYATVVNVDEVPARLEDKMETFFMVCFYFNNYEYTLIKALVITERNPQIPFPSF
jgi:hypothetical protein